MSTRCILLKTIQHEVVAGTRGHILQEYDDGQVKVQFNGWTSPHKLPKRLVKVVEVWCKQ